MGNLRFRGNFVHITLRDVIRVNLPGLGNPVQAPYYPFSYSRYRRNFLFIWKFDNRLIWRRALNNLPKFQLINGTGRNEIYIKWAESYNCLNQISFLYIMAQSGVKMKYEFFEADWLATNIVR